MRESTREINESVDSLPVGRQAYLPAGRPPEFIRRIGGREWHKITLDSRLRGNDK